MIEFVYPGSKQNSYRLAPVESSIQICNSSYFDISDENILRKTTVHALIERLPGGATVADNWLERIIRIEGGML